MSRKSKSEYIAEKRRAYGNAGKAKRSRILSPRDSTFIFAFRQSSTLAPKEPFG